MNRKTIFAFSCLAAFAFSLPSTVLAAGVEKKDKKPAAAEKAGEKKAADVPRPIPFHGTVGAVDASAKTFTLKGKTKDRVFSVTDKTVITKDNAPADLAAVTAGEEIRGQAMKAGDNWEAVKVMIGAREGAAKGGKSKAAPAAPSAPAPAAGAPSAPGGPASANSAASDAPAAPAGGAQ